MNRALWFLLGLWLMPNRVAGGPTPVTDKLHGKITVSEVDRVEVVLIIAPQRIIFTLAGPAPVSPGEFVDFTLAPHNAIKIGDRMLPIDKIDFVP